MLAGIKNMINSKIALQESAEVILEGSTGRDLDDLIVLGEETELGEFDETPADPEATGDAEEPGDGEEPKDDGGEEDVTPAEDNGDAMNDDIGAAPEEGDGSDDVGTLPGPEDDSASEHDMMNASIDDLPTPVGKQTGEPITDPVDDFMNVEIDMRSNTLSDVLPVPPSNAGEAVNSDDMMNQRIDSGFGGEEPSPAAAPPTPPEEQEESADDMMSSDFTEAISLDGGGDPAPADGAAATDSFGDPGPVDGGAADTGADPAPADGGEENAVTAAVRDKVSEADAPVDGGAGQPASKEELLKKLGNITKNLEDAKKAVMDSLQ